MLGKQLGSAQNTPGYIAIATIHPCNFGHVVKACTLLQFYHYEHYLEPFQEDDKLLLFELKWESVLNKKSSENLKFQRRLSLILWHINFGILKIICVFQIFIF